MTTTPACDPRTRASAALVGAAFVAAATGVLPLAGLAVEAAAPATPTPTPPTAPAPVTPVVTSPPAPVGPPAPTVRAKDEVEADGVRLEATLDRRAVLRRDGRVDLVVGVTVAPAQRSRDPIDLALVVDTSASMSPVMRLVKEATLGAIERLDERDRLVLVTYSDAAKVVFSGPVTAQARADLRQVVGRLVAARGTNLGDGMAAGLRGLSELPAREGADVPRRLVLLSDGAPTVGVTDPAALAAMPAPARGSVSVSCVGLGAAYEETLLAAIADSGGGRFHHVDAIAALDRVYGAELDDVRRLALRDARLRIEPAAGVEVERVSAWAHARERGSTTVALGDLAHGRALEVVVRLRVGAAAEGLVDVAAVRLEGTLQGARRDVDLATAPLSLALTDDPDEAARAVVAEAQGAVREADLAERLAEARAAAVRGERDRARALVREARALAGADDVTFTTPSGEPAVVNLDALADDLAEGARTERGLRAMKVTIAAERALGR